MWATALLLCGHSLAGFAADAPKGFKHPFAVRARKRDDFATMYQLDRFPPHLPDRLRKASLTGDAGRFIPGGQRRYLEILAAEVESRRGFLEAIDKPAGSSGEAAVKLAAATRALVGW